MRHLQRQLPGDDVVGAGRGKHHLPGGWDGDDTAVAPDHERRFAGHGRHRRSRQYDDLRDVNRQRSILLPPDRGSPEASGPDWRRRVRAR